MTEYLFQLPSESPPHGTLQARIQEMLVNAILEGRLAADRPLPSSRKLARQLAVARNTVVFAYQNLVDEGFLIARERSGFYINREILKGRAEVAHKQESVSPTHLPLTTHPARFRSFNKPADWHRYPYPFICGQYDRKLFPIADWRECCREAASIDAIHHWAGDHIDRDNAELIEQIQQKILPRRGVWADPEEILVTLGAQQGIYLIAQLLLSHSKTMGVESPGYIDAQNTFELFTPKIEPLAVDDYGLVADDAFSGCDCVYTTPSHHYPTTVTMPKSRRMELLRRADADNVIIIEDDYEAEFNYIGEPTRALKSLDSNRRVIYIGSLSKTLAPGIRLGYLVAPREFIEQARALRRLMLRHPPSNNQFIIARFLQRGYHDALITRLSHTLHQRWSLLGDLLEWHFPGSSTRPSFGGSAFWVEGAKHLDTNQLAKAAALEGVLFEPGKIFFHRHDRRGQPKHFFRLGFSAIPTDDIEPGIERLAALVKQQ